RPPRSRLGREGGGADLSLAARPRADDERAVASDRLELARVQLLDLGLVLRRDDGALDLHRRGPLAALLREVMRQDLGLLPLLDAGELLVDLVDVGADHLAQALACRPRGRILGHRRVLLRERRHLLGIESDERRQERAAVADDDALRDPPALPDLALEV